MISLPLGSILVIAVVAFAMSGSNILVFFNLHSVMIVLGGTMAVFAVATPASEILGVFRAVGALWRREKTMKEINDGLVRLVRNKAVKITALHSLIDFAQELWEQGVDHELFRMLLTQKLNDMGAVTEQSVTTLRNLAKYPPALGMTGTVMGLVTMFSGLTVESRDRLGPALALAMTATFYGLLVANMILMPLSDRIHMRHLSHTKINNHVYQALMLIHEGQPQGILEEEFHAVT